MGMKHEDERVALQAVEFWSTVCEEEVDLALEAQEVYFPLLIHLYLLISPPGSRVRRGP